MIIPISKNDKFQSMYANENVIVLLLLFFPNFYKIYSFETSHDLSKICLKYVLLIFGSNIICLHNIFKNQV